MKKHKSFSHRVTTAHFENNPKIVAFYAMSMRLEEERMLSDTDKKSWRQIFTPRGNTFICLNLDYVAVRSEFQGKGLGQIVMGKVIEDFAMIASACGIELMTGSAIDAETFKFYQRLGFQQYGHTSNQPQMYLPALSAIELVSMQSRALELENA